MKICRHFNVTDSSTIFSFGYDADSRVLEISFKSNSDLVYSFEGVPYEVFFQFLTAESMGSFFSNSIKAKFSNTDAGNHCHFVSPSGRTCMKSPGHTGSHMSQRNELDCPTAQ